MEWLELKCALARAILWSPCRGCPGRQPKYKLGVFRVLCADGTLEGLLKLKWYNLGCSGTLYTEGDLVGDWRQGGAQAGGSWGTLRRDHPGRTVVAAMGITWGNSRALCTEDALEGQLKLKCMQVGMSWGSPHRGEKDGTAEAEEGASWNIPRCSVSW